MTKLRTEHKGTRSEAGELSERVDNIVGPTWSGRDGDHGRPARSSAAGQGGARTPARRRRRRTPSRSSRSSPSSTSCPSEQAAEDPAPQRDARSPHARAIARDDRRRGLGRARHVPPARRAHAARHRRFARAARARLHRERRDARSDRLHHAQRRAQRVGRPLPRALGRQLSHHRASERRGHSWLGPSGHLRRRSAGGRRGRAQGHHRVLRGHLAGRAPRVPRPPRVVDGARDPSARRRGDGRLPGGEAASSSTS